jgi:arginyl-tRNA synthetase
LEKKGLGDVERLIKDAGTRFDYYCWDLYARVSHFYQENKDALAMRAETLKAIEEGYGEAARMAKLISTAIVRLHLETMRRINVQYDLLVEESEILRLDFWKAAFERMKQIGAIRYEPAGKNAGCWVMDLGTSEPESAEEEAGPEDVKIIVRSNGTVTYVGKDIAYHMWKFALLGKDFAYAPFYRYPGGHEAWHTGTESHSGAPEFGRASAAYAVIDTRQAYLQNIVAAAFRALGFHEAAENLHHFSYEVVGLSPACAREMGFELSSEDLERSYVEVSGRKGLGLKADDLIDMLGEKAREEVRAREMTKDPEEQSAYARMIAVGALRYFLLKFSCRAIITFDFKEALAFEGETGPYLLYSVVRARNIFRKYGEAHPEFKTELLAERVKRAQLESFFAGDDGTAFWELAVLAAQLEMVADQAIASTEPAAISKYAFRLAQAFNNFYHRFHILSEPDPSRQSFLLYLVQIVERTLAQTLDLLGIEVPERM